MGNLKRQQKYKNAADKSVKDTHDKIFSGAETPVGRESKYFTDLHKGGGKFTKAPGTDVEKDFPNVNLEHGDSLLKIKPNVADNLNGKSTKSKNWAPDRGSDTARRPNIDNTGGM